MTDEQIMRALCPIMGWEYKEFLAPVGVKDGKIYIPLENANHRDMVVKKMMEHKDVILGTKRKIYFCQIQEKTYPCPMDVTYVEHTKPGHAVCLAALNVEEGTWPIR